MNKKLSFNHNYPYYQDFLMKQILLNFVMNSNGNEIHKIFVIDNLLHEYKSNKANLMSTIFFISAYLFGFNGDKHIIEEYSDLSNSKSDFNVRNIIENIDCVLNSDNIEDISENVLKKYIKLMKFICKEFITEIDEKKQLVEKKVFKSDVIIQKSSLLELKLNNTDFIIKNMNEFKSNIKKIEKKVKQNKLEKNEK